MIPGLRQWQYSLVRNAIASYRESLAGANYYDKSKRFVELENGERAFSVLSPPLGSKAGRRRVRYIMRNVCNGNTVVHEDGSITWGGRTPHFITVALSYECQCSCTHCSADVYRKAVARVNGNLRRSGHAHGFLLALPGRCRTSMIFALAAGNA